MSIHLLVLEMKKILSSLDHCLDKAVAHAQAKKFEANVLLQARFAPDMFPLVRQIQIACDTAKFAAARAAGKEAPAHADDEQTIDDCKRRIATVIAYLDGFGADDFADDTRRISLPRWEGKSMSAREYVLEHATPNFFFHVVTSYDLLRHNGVEIGKRDFLGPMPLV
jgi:hypothetical protein